MIETPRFDGPGPVVAAPPRRAGAIGAPIDRVDGPLKVTGAARYPSEIAVANLAHAVLVASAIARGRIVRIGVAAALAAPGVLAVITHENIERLDGEAGGTGGVHKALLLMQDDRVRHDRQPIAVVVAERLEQAAYAASLLDVVYEPETPIVAMDDPRAERYEPEGESAERGDADAALAAAPVRLDATYVTPVEHHNPMEPHATTAWWLGETLTVHDASQGVFPARRKLAAVFGIPQSNVRVVTTFLGGGFGTKGSVWPHTVLAAVAARRVGRPVRLALTREQMFGSTGYRSRTVQRIAFGAERDGRLTATIHEVDAQTSTFDEWVESCAEITKILYECPNLRATTRLTKLDVGTPTFMRAPGEAPGSFALESAMDELAEAAGVDPLEIRLRNYADAEPGSGRPWSSKALRACYLRGAERFDWTGSRARRPGTRREGDLLIGCGVATASYPTRRGRAAATARITDDGSALVQSGSQDLGTGTYTIMTQIAAEALGLPLDRVRFELGDTEMPLAPISGGSQTAASVGSAVKLAADALRRAVLEKALHDPQSPLHGRDESEIEVADGRFFVRERPAMSESYREILLRAGVPEVQVRADSAPGEERERFGMHAWGAHFVELGVDARLGTVRLRRWVGAYAGGRILNAKTARSQIIGGIVGGIGMGLLEHTLTDDRYGRVVSANLWRYLVPVCTDVPKIEVEFVDEDDPHVNEVGAKGLGELAITGSAAAIANAVFNATGKRIRELPITPEKLLLD